jgi:transposase
LAIVRDDDVCRRLMTTTGVGPVVALTYRATVDVPARFRNSKAVGAVFGLTPSKRQSGEIDRMGGISKCGDAMMRTVLFEAAQSRLTRTIKWSWLKALGHEDRQKARNKTRDRRRGTADGGRDAPDMGCRHRLDQGFHGGMTTILSQMR